MADEGYHRLVKRSILAIVAVFGLALVPVLSAQINGVPASVTSIGFGGNFSRPPGVPPSVTSIGPAGLVPNRTFITQNPYFPQQVSRHPRHEHRGNGGVVLYPVPYAVPYAVPVEAVPVEAEPDDADEYSQDQYPGGTTIFDRRGMGEPAPQSYVPPAQAQSSPSTQPESAEQEEPPQPPTVLVFKDGHRIDVENYAIVGDTLYDMTLGHRRRVPLSELNLNQTEQVNEEQGTDFQVPAGYANN
jgi:hypothetical protein